MGKLNFGNYAIIDEIKHDFEKNPDWWWKIKPPTSGDELSISRFLVQARIEMGPDGVRREYPPTNVEIAHREIALTFAGTNIPASETPVEEGGEPVLKAGTEVGEIEKILRLMPHEMVMEIWSALGEAVVGWGPLRSPKVKKNKPEETTSSPS
jgi:hypothetical protein